MKSSNHINTTHHCIRTNKVYCLRIYVLAYCTRMYVYPYVYIYNMCTHTVCTGAQHAGAYDLRAAKVQHGGDGALAGRQVPRDAECAEPGGVHAAAADVRHLGLDDRQRGAAMQRRPRGRIRNSGILYESRAPIYCTSMYTA